jgi:hypothetical protein
MAPLPTMYGQGMAPGSMNAALSGYYSTENKENIDPATQSIPEDLIDPRLLPKENDHAETTQSKKRPREESNEGQNVFNTNDPVGQNEPWMLQRPAEVSNDNYGFQNAYPPMLTSAADPQPKRRRFEEPSNGRHGWNMNNPGSQGQPLPFVGGDPFQPLADSIYTNSQRQHQTAQFPTPLGVSPVSRASVGANGNVTTRSSSSNIVGNQSALDTVWNEAKLAKVTIIRPHLEHINLNWNHVDDVLKELAGRFGITIHPYATDVPLSNSKKDPTRKPIVWNVVFLRLILGLDHRKTAQVLGALAKIKAHQSSTQDEQQGISTASVNGSWSRNAQRILALQGAQNFDTEAFDKALATKKGGRRRQYSRKRPADDVGSQVNDTETATPAAKRVRGDPGSTNGSMNQGTMATTAPSMPSTTGDSRPRVTQAPVTTPAPIMTPVPTMIRPSTGLTEQNANQTPGTTAVPSPAARVGNPNQGSMVAPLTRSNRTSSARPTAITATATASAPSINTSSTGAAEHAIVEEELVYAKRLFRERMHHLLSHVATRMSQRYGKPFTAEQIAANMPNYDFKDPYPDING